MLANALTLWCRRCCVNLIVHSSFHPDGSHPFPRPLTKGETRKPWFCTPSDNFLNSARSSSSLLLVVRLQALEVDLQFKQRVYMVPPGPALHAQHPVDPQSTACHLVSSHRPAFAGAFGQACRTCQCLFGLSCITCIHHVAPDPAGQLQIAN